MESGSRFSRRNAGTSARGRKVPETQLSPKKHTVTKIRQNRGTLEALLGDISSWVAVGSLEEV